MFSASTIPTTFELGESPAKIEFDEGTVPFVAQSVLAVEVREFAYRTSHGINHTLHPTEDAAAEAAGDAGHLSFAVVEVQHVAAYTITDVPFIPPTELMA